MSRIYQYVLVVNEKIDGKRMCRTSAGSGIYIFERMTTVDNVDRLPAHEDPQDKRMNRKG